MNISAILSLLMHNGCQTCSLMVRKLILNGETVVRPHWSAPLVVITGLFCEVSDMFWGSWPSVWRRARCWMSRDVTPLLLPAALEKRKQEIYIAAMLFDGSHMSHNFNKLKYEGSRTDWLWEHFISPGYSGSYHKIHRPRQDGQFMSQ